MAAKWLYPKTLPTSTQGRSTAEESFSLESHSNLEILFREAIQNPLDARSRGNSGPVKLHIRLLKPGQYKADYLRKLLPQEFVSRLETAKESSAGLDFPEANVLVIEDFGTTGLLGRYDDPFADGSNQNWNAFWLREGEGAKPTGSNGGAGQGKITYFRISNARAVFGLTVREDDKLSLLMGRGSFKRDYHWNPDGKKYQRDSFWCNATGEGEDLRMLPEQDPQAISEFREAFDLERKTDQPGLSLVIPFISDIPVKEALETVLKEFYFPIAKGRLEILVDEYLINSSNIRAIASQILNDAKLRSSKSSFTEGYRGFIDSILASRMGDAEPVKLLAGWDNKSEITESHFPEGSIETIKASLVNGEIVGIRCPVITRPLNKDPVTTFFDVYLQVPEDLDKPEEAYIRKDLLIGGEKRLVNAPYLPKARALTLIKDEALSTFLVMAEMPNHLTWNGKRQRLTELYKNSDALSSVRNAVPRLLAFLMEGSMQKDIKALAKYFNKPSEEQKAKANSNEDENRNKGKKDVVDIPARIKPFRLDPGPDYIRVIPNQHLHADSLPMECLLEMAYEGLDHNPFNAYDPFDFDVADESAHPISARGLTILERKENRIEFSVTEANFELRISGFEPHVRLRARLTYKEDRDGETVSE